MLAWLGKSGSETGDNNGDAESLVNQGTTSYQCRLESTRLGNEQPHTKQHSNEGMRKIIISLTKHKNKKCQDLQVMMLHQRRGGLSNEPQNRREGNPINASFRDASSSTYYADDGDEEEKRRAEMFDRSCGLAQFFVNPWLFLWLRCQKLRSICAALLSICRKDRNQGRDKKGYFHLHNGGRYQCRNRQCRRIVLFPLGGICIITMVFWNMTPNNSNNKSNMYRQEAQFSADSIEIGLFKRSNRNTLKFAPNTNIFHKTVGPDYGGLDLSFPVSPSGQRTINYKVSSFFDGDGDTKIYKHYEFGTKIKCQDVAWKQNYRPNCNFFHEINMANEDEEEKDVGYINSGFYRDVFSYNQNVPNANEKTLPDAMALKILSLKHNVTRETMLDINTEALVMEGLTMSPRIMNIYGHCSTTVGSEFVAGEIEKSIVPRGYMANAVSEGKAVIEPQNDLNGTEKLNIALEMARSIADLHGFKKGVIVHDDIQLRQWLRASDDGRLVLGDFNRAKIMRWNDEDREYCKFRSGTVFGDYRAPEEYREDKLDEKVDVYSFGNNIYALLTGLWPFYDLNETDEVQTKIKEGELPNIDDRYRTGSAEERLLVNIMEICWKFNSSERADIFEVVELLEEAYHDKGA